MNYRNDARKHLGQANAEMHGGSERRLRYAALELRMAMESLTYDRALAYKDEFPPDEYATWQPRKVMLVLLEIDPAADQNSALAAGVEVEPSAHPPVMKSLGSEMVLNMATLRKHYDALGSYLHVPTIQQTKDGKQHDFTKLRERCEQIAAYLAQVLSSKVFNVTLGEFSSIECVECGTRIRKRMPPGQQRLHVECFECIASYAILDNGDGKVEWKPLQQEVSCAKAGCAGGSVIWQREMQPGKYWRCRDCEGTNELTLGVRYEAPEQTVG